MEIEGKSTEQLKKEYENQVQQELSELAIFSEKLKADFADVDTEDEEVVAEKAKKKLLELIPDAGNTIKYLISHSESDAVRKDLAKFVFQTAMRAAEVAGDEDEVARLIKSLTSSN